MRHPNDSVLRTALAALTILFPRLKNYLDEAELRSFLNHERDQRIVDDRYTKGERLESIEFLNRHSGPHTDCATCLSYRTPAEAAALHDAVNQEIGFRWIQLVNSEHQVARGQSSKMAISNGERSVKLRVRTTACTG